ncbi:hypothetical protein [Candidatus Ichthyocystis hellenicum]|uniref:hypothetical protein n=1 Tax=Candidatus Ichthyocystis hellenicum TaxID=1561003 RepID=UPI000B82C265|nr:hypothetical protein [Candidatus Ichthyocystis hellenicum]
MSSVQKSCERVEDSIPELRDCAGVLHQEGVVDVASIPSCSNSERDGQSLVSSCKDLSGIEVSVEVDSGKHGSRKIGETIPALEEGIVRIECMFGVPVGSNSGESMCRIGRGVCILEDWVCEMERVVGRYDEIDPIEETVSVVEKAVDLLETGLALIDVATYECVGNDYKQQGKYESLLERRIHRIERGVRLLHSLKRRLSRIEAVASNSGTEGTGGITEDHSLKELEDIVDVYCKAEGTPSVSKSELEFVMTDVVCSYIGDPKFCSLLKNLIKAVFCRFVSSNMCEDEYKQKDFFLSRLGGAVGSSGVEGASGVEANPSAKEVVEAILRVAVTIVVELDEGCDFLSKASDKVKRYFTLYLGIKDKDLICKLLQKELGILVNYEESDSINKGVMSAVVRLLNHVSSESCCLAYNKYYDDLQARASLGPLSVGAFLRRIIVLLILFPEALHPAIVHNKGLSKETFGKFFTPEGRCYLKPNEVGDVDSGEKVLGDDLFFWADSASCSDESESDEA